MPEIRAAPAEYNDDSTGFRKEGGGRRQSGGPILAGTAVSAVNRRAGSGRQRRRRDRRRAWHFRSLGSGGSGDGFAGRGKGNRERLVGRGAGTKDTEVAVAAALNWFLPSSQSERKLEPVAFATHCTGILAGPRHRGFRHGRHGAGPVAISRRRRNAQRKRPLSGRRQAGLYFLSRRQAASGDLSAGTGHQMYAHALATLALCEAYGMTKDPKIGDAAQRAVNFIEAAQNRSTGGWRYVPGDPTGGDTSVLGWQMMALRSTNSPD